MIHELTVFHVYVPSQGIKQKPERRELVHTLSFQQSIRHNIRTRKLISPLTLTQSIGLRTSVLHRSVGHTLNLQQVAAKNPIELSVNDLLFHWQTIIQPLTGEVESLLNLTQTVNGDGCTGVPTTLTWTQSVIGNVVRARTVTHNTGLVSGVSAWLSDPNFNFLNPVFSIIEQVRFSYQGTQFYLRKPDFDDTYKYDFTRINRRSRGGDLLISRDDNLPWPAVKSWTIHFSYLSQAEIDVLLNFMKLTLGKRCRYLNYDNVEWEGFITNPQTTAQAVGRSNNAITIEFEGEPV